MLGRSMKAVGYVIWFIAALVVSLYLTIPEKRVKTFIQHKASKHLKTSVKIRSVAIRGITGVTLEGVRVTLDIPANGVDGNEQSGFSKAGGPGKSPAPAKVTPAAGSENSENEGGEPKSITNPPGLIDAEKIALDINTFGLIMGKKLKARLNAEVSGGTIEDASLEASKDGWIAKIEKISDIDLTPTRIFKKLFKTDFQSRLSGSMNGIWRGSVAKSQGKLNLELSDTMVPHLELKDFRTGHLMMDTFQVHLGDIQIQLLLDKKGNLPGLGGRADDGPTTLLIDKLKAKGDSVEIQLDSAQKKHTLIFNDKKLGDSILNIKFVVFLTDEFYKWRGDGVHSNGTIIKDVSHELAKPILEGPNSPLRRARIRLGKKYYYGFHCTGPLKLFPKSCRPSAPSRRISPRVALEKNAAAKTSPKPRRPKPSVVTKRPKKPRPTASRSKNRPSTKKARTVSSRDRSRKDRSVSKPKAKLPARNVNARSPKGPTRSTVTRTVAEEVDEDEEEDDDEEEENDDEEDEDDEDDEDDDEEEDEEEEED